MIAVKNLQPLLGIIFSCALATSSPAADWLTLPSTYTHDAHGHRTDQHTPPVAGFAPQVSNFRSSGYTHVRSSIQVGQSADHYHRVQEWGDPVRPYGEWRFPFRPFATPYPNWGPPFAGLGPIGGVFPGFGLPLPPGVVPPGTVPPGGGIPGGPFGFPANPGNPYPAVPQGGYGVPPHYDGSYPDYPYRAPQTDQQFFYRPTQ